MLPSSAGVRMLLQFGCCCGPAGSHALTLPGPSQQNLVGCLGNGAEIPAGVGTRRAPASLAQATSAKDRKLFGDCGWGLVNLGELPLAGRKESEWWSPPALSLPLPVGPPALRCVPEARAPRPELGRF